MDNRVLERIVIGILLLLNFFLAAVVLSDRAEAGRRSAEITAHVIDLLAENGIVAGEKAVTPASAPRRCTLLRSSQKESEIVRGLIGTATSEDQGGNILFYRTEKGQAVFRGSGEIAVLYTSDAAPLRHGEERTIRRLLKQAGLEAELLPAGENDAWASVDARCCWNGYPVYNAVLRFDCGESGIYMITGTRVFDSLEEESTVELLDSVSALLRFVEIVKDEGIICSRLDGVQPGYLQTVVVSGESTLTPVWCIETDTGEILISAETGERMTAS